MRKIIVAATCLLSAPALAVPDWRMAANSTTGPRFIAAYVDFASLKRNGDSISFWVDYIEIGRPKYDETKDFDRGDCSSKYVETVQTDYYLAGKIIGEDNAAHGAYAIPSSMLDAVLDAACSGELAKSKSVSDPYGEQRGDNDAIIAALTEGTHKSAPKKRSVHRR